MKYFRVSSSYQQKRYLTIDIFYQLVDTRVLRFMVGLSLAVIHLK